MTNHVKKVYYLNWETLTIHEVSEPYSVSIDNKRFFDNLLEAGKMRDYLDTEIKFND